MVINYRKTFVDKITLKEALAFKAQMAGRLDNRGQLILQENGEIRLAARHRANDTPARELNEADISFPLARPSGSAAGLKDFVNSAPVRDLLATVHAGHKVGWDGQGRLTEEATGAYLRTFEKFQDYARQVETKALRALEKPLNKSKGR